MGGTQMYTVRFFKGEMAKIFIGNVSGEMMADSRNTLECRSEGGNPPPELKARIEKNGKKTRNLDILSDDDGYEPGKKRRTFLLNPRVDERSDSRTFAVCEAVQKAGKQKVYADVEAKSRLRIVYPPQGHNVKYVYANLGETAATSFNVEAFPRPSKEDVIWPATETDSKYRMNVAFTSSSITKVDLTVKNQHGEQAFHFEIVKPTPGWVYALVALAVLGVIALCCFGVYRTRKTD